MQPICWTGALRLAGLAAAFAAAYGVGPTLADDSTPSATAATTLGVTTGPSPDTGVAVGPLLVYPQFFIGGVYNDNIDATATNRVGALGLRATPSLSGVDDEGLHKTQFNLTVDGQVYPGLSSTATANDSGQSYVSVNATAEHTWTPTRDVTVDASAGFSRSSGFFNSAVSNSSSYVSSSFVSTSLLNVGLVQQFTDVLSGNAYVEKRFNDQWFLRGGVGVADVIYEAPTSGVSGLLDVVDINGFLRTGFYVLPSVNAFVEVGDDAKEYHIDWYDTNAQRVIAGLNSDLISLFRGEVYAGYQWQESVHDVFGSVSAPTYGAKLYYYPTRQLTLAASLNQSFGTAAVENVSGTFVGAPSTTTLQARGEADYKLADYWSIEVHGGWGRSTSTNSTVADTVWAAGGGLSYNFWRNLSSSLDYEYVRTSSNTPTLLGYTQNVVSAGVTYRY